MYGMINQAVVEYARTAHGEDVSRRLIEKTDGEQPYVVLEQYPDEDSVGLVVALAEITGMEAGKVLEEVGYFWVNYARESGYGGMFEIGGADLISFLKNLDAMHDRLTMSFEKMQAPSFKCRDITEAGLVVEYRSVRGGLGPMVRGILRGLGDHFDQPITVNDGPNRAADGLDHDEFLVEFVGA